MIKYDIDELIKELAENGQLIDIIQRLNVISMNMDAIKNVKKHVESMNLSEYAFYRYRDMVREINFYISNGIKPSGLNKNEFNKIKPIITSIVQNGGLSPSILDDFL